MARVFGIQGNVTGKIANVVYSVVKGVNVARAYNPEPANPQTEKQVESRAKLKELSQLAAALAPLMAYQPQGLVSARNLFIKNNYEKVSYAADVANIQLGNVDLSGSRVGLGDLGITRNETSVQPTLAEPAEGLIAVCYGVTIVRPNGAIIVRPPVIVTSPGLNNDWATSIPLASDDQGTLFAWGIRANDASQVAKYGYIMAATDSVVSLMATIKTQYAGSQTTTETLTKGVPQYT